MFAVLCLEIVGVAGLITKWSAGQWTLGSVIGLVTAAALVYLFSMASWVRYSVSPNFRTYMDDKRTAVIVLLHDRKAGRWELKNHVVKKTRQKYGWQLREVMAAPIQRAAIEAGVGIYGKAADKKVQRSISSNSNRGACGRRATEKSSGPEH